MERSVNELERPADHPVDAMRGSWTAVTTGGVTTPDPSGRAGGAGWRQSAGGVVLLAAGIVAAIASLLFWNLSDVPSPWFDEGVHLNAAWTLASRGQYGLTDATGTARYDPQVQVGPALILPVAAAFKVAGLAFGTARLVVAIYGCLCLLLAFWSVYRLSAGHATAGLLAAWWLAAGSPETFASVGFMSRQVVGEVPALAFVLAGLALSTAELARPHPRDDRALAAGIAWGLAMITKGQLLLLLPVVLLIVLVAARLRRDRGALRWGLRMGLGAAIPPVVWFGWQLAAIGPAAMLANAVQLRPGVATQIFSPDPAYVRNALGSLWRSGFLLTGAGGLVWAIGQARRPDREGMTWLFWTATSSVILCWFVAASVGWARYAIYPVAVSACLTAALIGRWSRQHPAVGRALLSLGFALGIITGAEVALRIATPRWTGMASMERVLETQLPPSARIESWDWQVGLATPERFQRQTLAEVYRVTGHIMRREPLPSASLAGRPCAEYLLEGPFSTWTGIYRPLHERGVTRRLVAHGDYQLFRVLDGAGCGPWAIAAPGQADDRRHDVGARAR
jgi:hypothetical protein